METKLLLFVVLLFAFASCQRVPNRRTSNIRCPPLTPIEKGRYIIRKRDEVKVICDDGYRYLSSGRPSLNSVLKCKNGKWSDANPACYLKEFTCEPPQSIENGKIRETPPYSRGSSIQYICDEGFILIGNSHRICQTRTLTWDGLDPECIKYDPSIGGVANRISEQIDKIESDSKLGRHIGYDVELKGLDLFLVFDKSSSIRPSEFDQGIQFAQFLIERFNISNTDTSKKGGTRLSVLTFGDEQKEEITLDDKTVLSTELAIQRLGQIKCGILCDGSTNMAAALKRIVQVINAKKVRKDAKLAMFLTSDGVPNAGEESVQSLATQLKSKNMEIFTIGIGHEIEEDLLQEIANKPAIEHVFLLKQFKDFDDMVKIIREKVPPTPPPRPDQCGYSVNPEVIKTSKALTLKAEYHPWLAAVIVSQGIGRASFRCSAALICNDVVITSASCLLKNPEPTKKDEKLIPLNASDVYVILGEDHLVKDSGKEQLISAEEIIIAEEYTNPKKIEFNVGLIKLKEPVKLNNSTRKICLLTDESISSRPDFSVYMIGWLKKTEDLSRTKHLQLPVSVFEPTQMKLSVASIEDCNQLTKKDYACEEHTLGSARKGRIFSDCNEDIGNLILAEEQGRMNLIGVVTDSKGCALNDKFVFFNRISEHIDWIKFKTNCLDEDDA